MGDHVKVGVVGKKGRGADGSRLKFAGSRMVRLLKNWFMFKEARRWWKMKDCAGRVANQKTKADQKFNIKW